MTVKLQQKITLGLMVFAILVFNSITSAQKNVFVFVHGNYLGALDESSKNTYSNGLGGEVGGAIGNGKTYFTGTIGYTQFSAKDGNRFGYENQSFVPVKIGIRQNLPFLLNMIYLHADGGLGFVNNKASIPAVDSLSKSRLAFDIGAGVKLGNIDLGIVWDSFKEIKPGGWSSWLGVKFGYRFDVIGSSKK